MSEFEERLNAILNDPAEMERITRLAGKLRGAGGEDAAPAAAEVPDGDGELLGRLGKLLHGGSAESDKTALLRALMPYLRPERQARLQKAMRLAKVARLATAALGGDGGERNV